MTYVKKGSIGVRIMSLVLMFILAFDMVVPVSAATRGGANTQTITVTTKSNWWAPGGESITLKQNKVSYNYQQYNLWKRRWETKTGTIYPSYKITIKNASGKTIATKTMTGSSIKLSLGRDQTYKITISYDSTSTWLRSNCKYATPSKGGPSWWVSSTCKVSSCS